MRTLIGSLIAAALAALMSGCVTLGHASDPIPVRMVPAQGSDFAVLEAGEAASPMPKTLVVVLPGIGSDARDLQRHHVAKAIQRQWPEADVVLTSAALAYYAPDGRLVERLREEIIVPARAEGYERIWLIGASLGGLGALLYEQKYPGELTGVVAFAPFLGDEKLPEQIRAAGGIQAWQPPKVTRQVRNPYTGYPRLIWAMAREWLHRPAVAERIWIVCGDQDNLKPDVDLLASALPDAHYVEVEGGHRWSVWLASLDATFRRIRTANT